MLEASKITRDLEIARNQVVQQIRRRRNESLDFDKPRR